MSYTVPSTNDHITAVNSSPVGTDAAGNMTSKPSLSLTFDDWSRLRTATAGGITTTYSVNGLHERVSKTDGTTSKRVKA
jgi:hypothetical protein